MDRHITIDRMPSGVFFSGGPNKRPTKRELREVNFVSTKKQKGMGYKRGTQNSSYMTEVEETTTERLPNPFVEFRTDSTFKQPRQRIQKLSPYRSKSPSPDHQPKLCLPLLGVQVEVLVDGTVARTKLVQSFTNVSKDDIPEAHYTFPLYNGAVVTSFTCNVGDFRELEGHVKPKAEAKQQFKKAIQKRQAAALLEEHTPEVFETIIGNIPANTVVKVIINYVNELKAVMVGNGKQGLAVIIPMSIAPRYGDPPEGYVPSPDLEDNGLEIVIKANDNGTIESLDPTSGHAIKTSSSVITAQAADFADLAKGKQKETSTDVRQLVAHFQSYRSILKEDFVVTIEMHNKHQLRSRAVLALVGRHAALMVNIKPGDLFSDTVRAENSAGEIVFVIDRSDSMGWSTFSTRGSKIGTLRQAMPLSLVSLPTTCAFNIVSFGDETHSLWETSLPYSQENLNFAKEYVSSVEADMGGTELLTALEVVVERRLKDRDSTQIIIITDGELEAVEITQFICKTRQDLQDKIRFFSLGIGDRVSHSLIECIGEFGGGYGEVVDIFAKPRWEDRLSLMLKSALMPNSWTCEIGLGPGFERKSLAAYKFEEESQPKNLSVPYIQAPYPTPPLHPFAYKSIFLLLDLGTKSPPKEVTLRTTTAGTRAKTFTLEVEPVLITETPMIHHLATKAALLGLETEVGQGSPGRAAANLAKQNAESLGMRYSITSKWTSFVAIDRTSEVTNDVELYKADLIEFDLELPRELSSDDDASMSSDSTFSAKSLHMRGGPSGNRDRQPPIAISQELREIVDSDRTYAVSHRKVPGDSMPISRRTQEGLRRPILRHWSSAPVRILESRSSDEEDEDEDEDERHQNAGFSNYNSDQSSDYDGESSENSDSDDLDGSITWQVAVASQNAIGTFQLSEYLKEKLASHFCPGTTRVVNEALARYSKVGQISEEEREIFVDTLMVVQHFKTHMAQQRDLWYLMMEKAEYSVQKALQLLDDEDKIDYINSLLESSIMHAHFLPAAQWPDDGTPGPFPYIKSKKSCLVCRSMSSKPSPLTCPYKECDSSASKWSDWEGLWNHQIESGHIVCRETLV